MTLRGDEATKGQAILITGGGFYTSRTFARQDITILAGQDTTIAGVTVSQNFPENSGAPDQTFDDWRLQGVSDQFTEQFSARLCKG